MNIDRSKHNRDYKELIKTQNVHRYEEFSWIHQLLQLFYTKKCSSGQTTVSFFSGEISSTN